MRSKGSPVFKSNGTRVSNGGTIAVGKYIYVYPQIKVGWLAGRADNDVLVVLLRMYPVSTCGTVRLAVVILDQVDYIILPSAYFQRNSWTKRLRGTCSTIDGGKATVYE